jgi:hypothetical protein
MSHHRQHPVQISFDHPNVSNAECFLNSWTEPFNLEKAEENRFTFRSEVSGTEVTVLFFDDYREAADYEKRHFLPRSAAACSTVNGGALYVILGNDPDLVVSLAGHFAGKE